MCSACQTAAMPASDPDTAKTAAALTAAQLYYMQDLTMEAIAAELGAPVEALFSSFSEPVAAASIAQVHQARVIETGQEVAVKVLRPGIERAFRRDIDAFYFAARSMEYIAPFSRRLRPVDVIAHFEGVVMGELDLRLESSAAAEFAANTEKDEGFQVPKPHWFLSSRNVMTMGWAEELKKDGIAANALWPRTTIDTAAVRNLLGGEALANMSRTVDVLADAAHMILSKPSNACTGNLFIDEDVPGGASAYMFQQVIEIQGGYRYLDVAARTLSAKAHRPAYASDGDYFSKPSVDDMVEKIYAVFHEANPKYPDHSSQNLPKVQTHFVLFPIRHNQWKCFLLEHNV